MPDKRLSQLEELVAIGPEDIFYMVDITGTTATSKKATVGQFTDLISNESIWNANRLADIPINKQQLATNRYLQYNGSEITFKEIEISLPIANPNNVGGVKLAQASSNAIVYPKEAVDSLHDSLLELLDSHLQNNTNPHGVTALQVGAIPSSQKGTPGGVATLDNSGTLSINIIPPSIARTEDLFLHVLNSNNPHQVTALQIGAIEITSKGQPLGVATLDNIGKIPNSQLPSTTVPKASTSTSGTVKTNIVDADPIVYTQAQVDALLQSREPLITTLPIVKGGTGANTPSGVLLNIGAAALVDLQIHTANVSNPHMVTAQQVGAVSTSSFELNIGAVEGALLAYNSNTEKYEPVTELDNIITDGGWF